MLSLYLLCSLLLLLIANYLWSRRKFYIISWKLPGPFALPLIGSAWKFRNPNTILRVINDLRNFYKSEARFWLGSNLVIYVQDLNLIQKVLNSPDCLNKADVYRFVGKFLGQGIFISEKSRWTRNRRLITPSFNHRVLTSFFPVFNTQLNLLASKLGEKVGKGEFCVTDYVFRANIDISCETTMGTKIETQNMQNQHLFDAYRNAKLVSGIRIFSPWLQPDTLFKFSKLYEVQEQSRKVLVQFIDKLIKSKSSKMNNNSIAMRRGSDSDGIVKEDNIFIDNAMKLLQQEKFDARDIHDESNFVAAAAFDTTAVTETFLIQCLAMFPECQEKVYQELKSIFPTQDVEVTFEDAKNMVYCEMVINETLRLFPSVPVIGRKPSADVRLKDDLVLPKDCLVVIDILSTHRDPDLWGPTAHTFNPNRFISSELEKIHPYAFIPFSKGPRNCIGWRYAMFSLKVFIAKIFRKYYFTTKQKVEDFQFRMEITITPLITPTVEIHQRTD